MVLILSLCQWPPKVQGKGLQVGSGIASQPRLGQKPSTMLRATFSMNVKPTLQRGSLPCHMVPPYHGPYAPGPKAPASGAKCPENAMGVL